MASILRPVVWVKIDGMWVYKDKKEYEKECKE